jgi:acyl-CoA synthetase
VCGSENDPQHLHTFNCVKVNKTSLGLLSSLEVSLQELQHAFIFLPTEGNESQSIINDLGLVWVLSFTSSDKCEATLALNGHKLILEKHLSQKKKYENIFYVIRTSGTTGQNKFVRVGKHCIESNVKSLSKIFDVKSTDTIFFGTPLTFDPSMIELLLALHNNACLLITSPNNHVNPARLHQTLFHPQNGVSVLQIVPSLFQRWSQTQIESILVNPRLRVLAFGGEFFPRSVLEYKKSDGLKIFNLYGITEVSCWATACETTGEELDEVALGHALEDTVVELRDEKGGKVTNGEGEIYIGSENRMCFVDDESVHLQKVIFRATGDMAYVNERGLFYKGRKNDVFKRLGHKLHLSKIEEMIKNETGLDNKCVWCRTQSKLLAFFVIGSFDKNTKDKILDKVKIKMLHTLPRHCFPDYVDIVRKCPITSHGKTDKKALESLFLHRNRPDKRSVIDTFTSLICQYFGFDLNQLSKIQKNTFFEIGGNSILAVQLLNEFRDELGGECPPDLVTALFEKDLKACFDSARLVTLAPSRKRPQTPKTDTNCVLKKIQKRGSTDDRVETQLGSVRRLFSPRFSSQVIRTHT